ncbi:MAG: GDYXXLXY domain-containing protein [Bdellovibrionaceae bacterium]|nr:GDYXXLXY domain-containing protein [Pseudobdellovibrionaceae bacterium]NUM58069.1 GDYXXLXY domain-containing protein [Pseudobdellovibrionaceae bacterium]
MKNRILWVNAILFLFVFNYLIIQKEQLIASGKEIYLELIPMDPRSLLQGDYMNLRYQITTESSLKSEGSEDGFIIANLDVNKIATFRRISSSTDTIGPDEIKIKYRRRGPTVKIATDAFFFQNGQAELYSKAKYGILKVDDDGEVILTGLANKPGEKL